MTVLRDGQSIATRAMREVDRAELIRLMVGREISAIFPKRAVPIGDVVLEMRGLELRGGVAMSRAGAARSSASRAWSGRDGRELAETLFGLAPADAARSCCAASPCASRSPADAIRLGIGYVPEDRRQHGVVLEMPIAANASLANLRRGLAARHDRWRRCERDLARTYVERLRIKTRIAVRRGRLALRRQPAEGRAGALAGDPARRC